ncbi:endonuclease domain-containing protein [Mangrovibacterium diazotrophicum]|nr:endonuclease domain-containing protein [Mangrovibacterium diazotrophicum]
MSISNQVSMFYNAKPHIFEKAKTLRENMTSAELNLWEKLKRRQVLGLRFRPQHPIDIFIADFYCHPLKLVIEIDGGIHLVPEHKEYDIGRTAELNQWGIQVIRFTNEEVANNLEKVVSQINLICRQKLSEGKVPFRGFRG